MSVHALVPEPALPTTEVWVGWYLGERGGTWRAVARAVTRGRAEYDLRLFCTRHGGGWVAVLPEGDHPSRHPLAQP
jgi:hypothetical protein